jgi:hypothetical protein
MEFINKGTDKDGIVLEVQVNGVYYGFIRRFNCSTYEFMMGKRRYEMSSDMLRKIAVKLEVLNG